MDRWVEYSSHHVARVIYHHIPHMAYSLLIMPIMSNRTKNMYIRTVNSTVVRAFIPRCETKEDPEPLFPSARLCLVAIHPSPQNFSICYIICT